MCTPGIRAGLVGSLWWLLVAPGIARAAPPAAFHQRVVRVPDNDSLTPANLGALVRGSPTARAVIERLEHTPDVVLIVRAHPLLAREERVCGRGRFWVVSGRLYGLLEYQAEPLNSRRALRVLAHELAHALEVTASVWRHDEGALRSFVLAREVGEERDDVRGIETEFARAIGRRVATELVDRGDRESELDAIAERFAVQLPRPTGKLARALGAYH